MINVNYYMHAIAIIISTETRDKHTDKDLRWYDDLVACNIAHLPSETLVGIPLEDSSVDLVFLLKNMWCQYVNTI